MTDPTGHMAIDGTNRIGGGKPATKAPIVSKPKPVVDWSVYANGGNTNSQQIFQVIQMS